MITKIKSMLYAISPSIGLHDLKPNTVLANASYSLPTQTSSVRNMWQRIQAVRRLLLLVILLTGLWQPAALAVTNVSGLVNAYYPISAISGNTVTVGARTGNTHTLVVGDWVMLIQMTGDPSSNLGAYEVAQVSAVSGSTVTLSAITHSYTTSEKVQLVWMPYDATGISVASAGVTPLAWNGTTGGVVALKGSTLTLTGGINASATGFSSTLRPTASGSVNGVSIPAGGSCYGSLTGSSGGGGFLEVVVAAAMTVIGTFPPALVVVAVRLPLVGFQRVLVEQMVVMSAALARAVMDYPAVVIIIQKVQQVRVAVAMAAAAVRLAITPVRMIPPVVAGVAPIPVAVLGGKGDSLRIQLRVPRSITPAG